MATVQQRGAAFQLRVRHKLLPRAFFATFDTQVEAKNYGEQLEAMLARGVVPQELLTVPAVVNDPLAYQIIRDYRMTSPALSDSDDVLFDVIVTDKPLIGLRLSGMTYRWVESYVAWLKSEEKNLSPSTIRKRIGALGRVIDWYIKRVTPDNAVPSVNALRMLPRGYSNYSKADARHAPVRRDIRRNRRLSPDEAKRIDAVLAGEKREDRERIFTNDEAFVMLYKVIIDTGMRLFEAFRLRSDSIDLEKGLINVDGSKGHRGVIKTRFVPIKPVLREPLREWCNNRTGLIFPYWDGTKEMRDKTSNKLSRRFAGLFDYAKVNDFTEHDLRHEAACRWFELRNERGWIFSEIEICRIMGWERTDMALRYASLRGEDLASRLT
jgi:integrase